MAVSLSRLPRRTGVLFAVGLAYVILNDSYGFAQSLGCCGEARTLC